MANNKYTAEIVLPKMTKSSYKMLLGTQREQKRSAIKILEAAKKITIQVEADDVTALRAALNTLIRDIQVIEAASRPGTGEVRPTKPSKGA